jgi:subtilisin-like proprotein convertase family protein
MIDSSRTSITVGAINDAGGSSSYSNYGANLLVSAPSNDGFFSSFGIKTTDLTGAAGYTAGDYTGADAGTGFGGTSAAAPMVSGVIALMLEAAPGLGWRDVQNILAYSATHTGARLNEEIDPFDFIAGLGLNGEWIFNAADNWNGGGLHFNIDYGFGAVDAFSAVRMAEVWHLFSDAQTSANEFNQSAGSQVDFAVSATGTQTVTFLASEMTVEAAEITLSLSDASVDVFLVSAEGTRVRLLDDAESSGALASWTFGAQTFRGEQAAGDWSLEFVGSGSATIVQDWEVKLFGEAANDDDVYHYTDDILADFVGDGAGNYASLSDDTSRTLLTDTGGDDWLNFAAMSYNLDISLEAGKATAIGSKTIMSIDADTVIENVVAGDRNDSVTGNDADNEIYGMRGNDTLAGGLGSDRLFGGAGADVFVFAAGDGADTIGDFDTGSDQVELWDLGILAFNDLSITNDTANNATIELGGGDALTFTGVLASDLSAAHFSFEDSLII